MQNSISGGLKKVRPQAVGRDTFPPSVRAGQNGSGQDTGNHGAAGGIGLHLLGKELRSFPKFEMMLRSGQMGYNNVLELISTEAKQLRVIEDLYSIVKAQPKYKTMKEPVWDENTQPVTVIHWLLRRLSPFAKGDFWTIDTWRLRNEVRYRFVTVSSYHGQLVKCREEFIALEFLPLLLKRDGALHDLIIDIIALVSKNNKVPLWDEDGDYSAALSLLKSRKAMGNSLVNRQIRSYLTGTARKYLLLIKSRRKHITPGKIEKKLAEYVPDSQRKREMVWWIRSGLQIAKKKDNISNYSYVPHFISGPAVGPSRLYKFVWSVSEQNILHATAAPRIRRDVRSYGYFLPCKFVVAKPGQVIESIKPSDFPIDFYRFMSEAVAMIEWRFKTYYYKNRQKDAKSLMDSIEESEILNVYRDELKLRK